MREFSALNSDAAAPRAGADRLTRTTLQIESGASVSAIDAAIRALQRVPGVLLADMHPASTRAVVAHDGAVKTSALVTAVAGAGIRASVVATPGTAVAEPASGLSNAAITRVVVTAMIVFAALTIVDLVLPDGSARRWLLPIVSMSIFVFLFTRSIGIRRP